MVGKSVKKNVKSIKVIFFNKKELEKIVCYCIFEKSCMSDYYEKKGLCKALRRTLNKRRNIKVKYE